MADDPGHYPSSLNFVFLALVFILPFGCSGKAVRGKSLVHTSLSALLRGTPINFEILFYFMVPGVIDSAKL